MTKDKINRINELAKKSKITALSPEEKKEQAELRREYINNMKTNFVGSIENMVFVDENGHKKPVKKKINLQQ